MTSQEKNNKKPPEDELYFQMFKQHSAIMLLIDPETGKIIDANTAAADFYGYTIDELKNQKIQDINALPPTEVAKRRQAAKQRKQNYFLFKHKIASGEIKDVEVHSVPIRFKEKTLLFSLIHDITQRCKAEKALKNSEEHFRSITANAPNYIMELNQDLNIIYTNQVNYYHIKEVMGQNALKFIPSEDRKRVEDIIRSVFNSGKKANYETRILLGNNTFRWFRTSVGAVMTEEGHVGSVILISEDINEQKENERKLIEAKEKAEESNKLKTAFLANMSHEIRTPMNGIINFSGFLLNPELSEAKRKEYTQAVIDSSERLLIIVNNIIDISLIESKQVKVSSGKVNINKLLKNLFDTYAPRAKQKNIRLNLNTHHPEENNIIYSDARKLQQILANLLDNALKFTHKGSIDFGYTIQGNNLEFFVKDTGIGIPNHLHKKIFESFRQVEMEPSRQFGGNGLGLTIAQKLSALLGAKISLESEENKGSVFYFTIPCKTTNIETSALLTNETEKQNQENPRYKILIAEDEEINYLFFKTVLKELNLESIHARNGLEAVKICKNDPNINLVFMDIKMPKMDGYEAVKHIREFNTDLQIIAQTGFTMANEQEKVRQAGFNDYISKPIYKEKLIATIKKCFQKQDLSL